MFEAATREEMDRLDRMVQRMFARVSVLEARVNELENELRSSRAAVRESERPRLVEVLRRPA